MTITYLQDIDFLLVESPKLDEVIANPSGFTSVTLTGDLNCGACATLFSEELPISATSSADLNTQVQLGKTIVNFKLINSITESLETAPVSINLSGVTSSCLSGNCTLETSPTNYADIFITALEGYFNSILVPIGTIVVAFEDNKLIVSGLPLNYSLYSFEDNTGVVGLFSLNLSESGILLTSQGLLVPPTFFGLMHYVDGVYQLELKITAVDNSYSIESNCIFVDVTFKCKVALYLKDISLGSAPKLGLMISMLHYGLTNSSNCGCNCPDMCRAYKELYSILNGAGLINQTSSNCGC